MKEIYTIMIILTIRFPKKKSAIKQSSTVCNDLFSPPKCLITGERLLILRLFSDTPLPPELIRILPPSLTLFITFRGIMKYKLFFSS